MKTDKALTPLTIEICEKLNNYCIEIRNDMIVGDTEIIKGIKLVKEIITNINPEEIDENIIIELKKALYKYYGKKAGNYEIVNTYFRFGTESGYMIINYYIKTKTYKKIKK